MIEDRLMDCEQLIAEGEINYEHAFKTMIKPQVERIVEAKNRVLGQEWSAESYHGIGDKGLK